MVKMKTLVDLLDWVPAVGLVKINYCDFSEGLIQSPTLMTANCIYQGLSTAAVGFYFLERIAQ
jgi:hypothetical protein